MASRQMAFVHPVGRTKVLRHKGSFHSSHAATRNRPSKGTKRVSQALDPNVGITSVTSDCRRHSDSCHCQALDGSISVKRMDRTRCDVPYYVHVGQEVLDLVGVPRPPFNVEDVTTFVFLVFTVMGLHWLMLFFSFFLSSSVVSVLFCSRFTWFACSRNQRSGFIGK